MANRFGVIAFCICFSAALTVDAAAKVIKLPRKLSASDRLDNLDFLLSGDQLIFQVLKEKDAALLEAAIARVRTRFTAIKQEFDLNKIRFPGVPNEGSEPTPLSVTDFVAENFDLSSYQVLKREGLHLPKAEINSKYFVALISGGEFEDASALIRECYKIENTVFGRDLSLKDWLAELLRLSVSEGIVANGNLYFVQIVRSQMMPRNYVSGVKSLVFAYLKGQIDSDLFLRQIQWAQELRGLLDETDLFALNALKSFQPTLLSSGGKISETLKTRILREDSPEHFQFEDFLKSLQELPHLDDDDFVFLEAEKFFSNDLKVLELFCKFAMGQNNLKWIAHTLGARNLVLLKTKSKKTIKDLLFDEILAIAEAPEKSAVREMDPAELAVYLNILFRDAETLNSMGENSDFAFLRIFESQMRMFIRDEKWGFSGETIDALSACKVAPQTAKARLLKMIRDLEKAEGPGFNIGSLWKDAEVGSALDQMLVDWPSEDLVKWVARGVVLNNSALFNRLLQFGLGTEDLRLSLQVISSFLNANTNLTSVPRSRRSRLEDLSLRLTKPKNDKVSWDELRKEFQEPLTTLIDLEALVRAKKENEALGYISKNGDQMVRDLGNQRKLIFHSGHYLTYIDSTSFGQALILAFKYDYEEVASKMIELIGFSDPFIRIQFNSDLNQVDSEITKITMDRLTIAILLRKENLIERFLTERLRQNWDFKEEASWTLTATEAALLMGWATLLESLAKHNPKISLPHLQWAIGEQDFDRSIDKSDTLSQADYLKWVAGWLAQYAKEYFDLPEDAGSTERISKMLVQLSISQRPVDIKIQALGEAKQ